MDWVTRRSPALPSWLFLAALAVGVAVAAHPLTWRATRLLATWFHETGHAVIALATGRNVSAIRLDAGSGGVTEHVGAARGVGRILTAFAGYPTPALAGTLMLWAVLTRHGTWAAAGLALAVAAMLPFQRSWRGLGVTAVLVASLWGLTVLDGTWAAVALVGLAGYLLAASPRTIVELHRARRSQAATDGRHSDADTLAGLTGMPAVGWEIIFMGVSVGMPAYLAYRHLLGG